MAKMRQNNLRKLPKLVYVCSPFNKGHLSLFLGKIYSEFGSTVIVTEDISYLGLKNYQEDTYGITPYPKVESENLSINVVPSVFDVELKEFSVYQFIIVEVTRDMPLLTPSMYIYLDTPEYYKSLLQTPEQRVKPMYTRVSKKRYALYNKESRSPHGFVNFDLLDKEICFTLGGNSLFDEVYTELYLNKSVQPRAIPPQIIEGLSMILEGKAGLTKTTIKQLLLKGELVIW